LLRLLETSCSHEKDSQPTETVSLNFDETALNVIPQAVRRGDFKGTLKLVRNSQIAIPLADLPTSLGAALKRLGTIANPLFYEKQRLRFPTVNIPRFIFCGEEHDDKLVKLNKQLKTVIAPREAEALQGSPRRSDAGHRFLQTGQRCLRPPGRG
jgi:hypothetical protein